MKIDHDYLKGLLNAFEEADSPTTDIYDLQERSYPYTDINFIFHLKLLNDQGFVVRDQGHGLGYSVGADGFVSWSVVDLRLTASGHEFISALHQAEVWNSIKSDFKDASIGTLWNVSKQLLEGFAKKKVAALIDGEEG